MNTSDIQLSEDLREQLDAIEGEIFWLLYSRRIYRDLSSIAQENPTINWDNPLYEWIFSNYAHSTIMYVRRLLDDHQIKKHMTISIVKFVQRLPDCESIKELISEAKNLRDRCERVLAFADKVVAHHDVVLPGETQIADMHKAIDDIVEFFERKVLPLFPANEYYKRKESYNIPRRLWDGILRKPWIVGEAPP